MNKDCVVNTLKGVAIGDAFCVGIEFSDREWIQQNLSFECFTNNRTGQYRKNIEPGFYSDDTEHTIAVLRALLSKNEFTADLLLQYFREEYETDKEIKGFGRQGHGSIQKWYDHRQTIEQVRASQASRKDPGNAPIMRLLPLAFLPSEYINQYATINANCTHPHPIAIEASITAAHIANFLLVYDGNVESIVDYVGEFVKTDTKANLEQVLDLPPREMLTDEDWLFLCGPQPISEPDLSLFGITARGLNCQVSKTVLTALYVLKHSSNAFEALKNSALMGGDIDTLAAFTVGILSGTTTLDSLPEFLIKQTEGLDRIEVLATKFANTLKI